MTDQPLSVTLSASFKVNLGNYESADCFLSVSGVTMETTPQEVEKLLDGPATEAWGALRERLAARAQELKTGVGERAEKDPVKPRKPAPVRINNPAGKILSLSTLVRLKLKALVELKAITEESIANEFGQERYRQEVMGTQPWKPDQEGLEGYIQALDRQITIHTKPRISAEGL